MKVNNNLNNKPTIENTTLNIRESFPHNYMDTSKIINFKLPLSQDYAQYYQQLPSSQSQSQAYALSQDYPQEYPPYASIKLSCDYITLSIFNSRSSIIPLLKALANNSVQETMSKHVLSPYRYTFRYLFKHFGKNYLIVVSYSNIQYLPTIFRVHDPDENIIQFLQPYLNNLTYYHINALELTFDFIHFDNDDLFRFLTSSLFLRWQSQDFDLPYVDTTYFDNPRMTRKKALRVYKKVVDDKEVIRLEIVLKRNLLKKQKIKFIEDLETITPELALKYISFKEFNFSKYRKRLAMLDYTKATIDNEINIIEDMLKNTGIRKANKYALNISKKYHKDTYLKKHPFDESFSAMLSGNSFLNGNTKSVKQ